jgi:hypothetical protein
MHFWRIEVGDRYSVSPEATLGPTPRELGVSSERLLGSYAASDQLASKKERRREFHSSWVCNWAIVTPTVVGE